MQPVSLVAAQLVSHYGITCAVRTQVQVHNRCPHLQAATSVTGPFQTSADATAMSAFLPLATTERTSLEVRFVPECMARTVRCKTEAPRPTNVRAATMYQASNVEHLLRAIMGIRAHQDCAIPRRLLLRHEPSQAPKSRPCLNPVPLPIAATTALDMIGPTPGTVIRR